MMQRLLILNQPYEDEHHDSVKIYGRSMECKSTPEKDPLTDTMLHWKSSFAILLLACLIGIQATLVIHSSPAAGTYVAFPIIYPNNFRNETITALIVSAKAPDVTGMLVLMAYDRGMYVSQIRSQQSRGALGVIIGDAHIPRPPGSANFILDGTSLDGIYLSAWQISSANFSRIAGILANGSFPVNATVDPLGNNPWLIWNETFMPFFSAFLGTYSAFLIVFSAVNLMLNLMAHGTRRKLPIICLVMIISGNIIRFAYVAVDPLFSRQIYPYSAGHALWTLSQPFTLTVTILITFYWHDVIHGMSLNVNQLVGKFKVPFFIIIGLLFGCEIAFGTLRAIAFVYPITVPTTTWTQVNGSFNAAVSLGLAIFYLVTAGKIIVILKHKKSTKKRLERITFRAIGVGICLIANAALFLAVVITGLSSPSGRGSLWFCIFVVLDTLDLMQSLIFFRKNGSSNSSTDKSNNASKNRQTRQSLAGVNTHTSTSQSADL